MVGVLFVYVDTVYGFYGYFFMLSWMFQHDYLDTYCFEYLRYVTVKLSNQEICKIPNIFREFIKLLFHSGNLQIS